jgi:RNA polymerase sigma-70 factor, ECF subfamily
MSQLDDEQLVRSIAAGQRASLGTLYERYNSMIKGAVTRFAPEISAAERDELVQDIFIAVGESAGRFSSDATFRSWLYSIAVNKTRKWRRNTWLRRRLLKEHNGGAVGMALKTDNCPEEIAILRQQIFNAIHALPVDQREVFVLYAAEGFKGDEIARILRISPATVRTRLHRARQKLLESITDDSVAPVKERIRQ